MQESLCEYLCSSSATPEKVIAFYVFIYEHVITVIIQQIFKLLLCAMPRARHWQDKGK